MIYIVVLIVSTCFVFFGCNDDESTESLVKDKEAIALNVLLGMLFRAEPNDIPVLLFGSLNENKIDMYLIDNKYVNLKFNS